MMIVIPMLIFSGTMWLFYDRVLGGDPRNVLTLCGALMFAAAASVWSVRERNAQGLPVGASA
jgi:maltose/moltooligosaccharide transporter